MKLELATVLDLLHSVHASTLATHSLQMSGYPYSTVVPNVLDEQHRPILLISALAKHTKNLLANPKVSISVSESGVSNVQDSRRRPGPAPAACRSCSAAAGGGFRAVVAVKLRLLVTGLPAPLTARGGASARTSA